MSCHTLYTLALYLGQQIYCFQSSHLSYSRGKAAFPIQTLHIKSFPALQLGSQERFCPQKASDFPFFFFLPGEMPYVYVIIFSHTLQAVIESDAFKWLTIKSETLPIIFTSPMWGTWVSHAAKTTRSGLKRHSWRFSGSNSFPHLKSNKSKRSRMRPKGQELNWGYSARDRLIHLMQRIKTRPERQTRLGDNEILVGHIKKRQIAAVGFM